MSCGPVVEVEGRQGGVRSELALEVLPRLGWGEGESQEWCSGGLGNLKAQISPEKYQTSNIVGESAEGDAENSQVGGLRWTPWSTSPPPCANLFGAHGMIKIGKAL